MWQRVEGVEFQTLPRGNVLVKLGEDEVLFSQQEFDTARHSGQGNPASFLFGLLQLASETPGRVADVDSGIK